MIVEAELRAFAKDRRRQRELGQSVNSFAAGWRQGPVNRRFAEAFQPLDRDDGDAVANAARALFNDDRWVDALVGMLADELRRNPWFEPPFQALLRFARSDDFAAKARELGGYDISGFGSVRWNAP